MSVSGAKAEVTVTNIITPHAIELLKMDIMDVSLISVEADASNHKEVTLLVSTALDYSCVM